MTISDIIAALPSLTIEQLSELSGSVANAMTIAMRGITSSGGLTVAEELALKSGDLMLCVRLIRARTGLSLRDAKDYMDRARGVHP